MYLRLCVFYVPVYVAVFVFVCVFHVPVYVAVFLFVSFLTVTTQYPIPNSTLHSLLSSYL